MFSSEELEELYTNRHTIKDNIKTDDLNIDTNLELDKRLLEYFNFSDNPYNFKCGDIGVVISYQETDLKLRDILKSHFVNKNN